jgi:Leucine-rich repeat (LRR) protein
VWFLFFLSSVQVKTIKLICDFEHGSLGHLNLQFYGCVAINLSISQENVKFSSIEGKHVDGKTNDDVASFFVMNQNTKFTVLGIEKYFPKFQIFSVFNSSLEIINKNSFRDLTQVFVLYLAKNNIVAIPEDTFKDLIHLKILDLAYNKLKSVPSNLLAELKNLEVFIIASSSVGVIPLGFFRANLKLVIILLSSNPLTSIDTTSIHQMKSLKLMNLQNNTCISKSFRKPSKKDIAEIKNKCSLQEKPKTMAKTEEKLKDNKQETNKTAAAKKGGAVKIKLSSVVFTYFLFALSI